MGLRISDLVHMSSSSQYQAPEKDRKFTKRYYKAQGLQEQAMLPRSQVRTAHYNMNIQEVLFD